MYEIKTPKERYDKWKLSNPLKVRAHKIVFTNLRNKKISKEPCFKCGSLDVQAHHEDYSKPLEIVWCCKKHHMELDKLRRNK